MEAKGLKKHFPVTRGLLFARIKGWVKAVDGVDFRIRAGDSFGLVGESGCGKTTVSKLILRLEDISGGSLQFDRQEVHQMKSNALSQYRRSIQAVFQDPYSSLNPRWRVREIISEPVVANLGGISKSERNERIAHALERVGLPRENASLYPHEFSGGQRQRIALARALVASPRLVILDEPISALDVSISAQIMNLLKTIQRDDPSLAYLMIAHNLATVRYMSTFVAVMYMGKIVESAPCEELFAHPAHPYTQALISATLPGHPSIKHKRIILGGEVPSPLNPPPGCHFNPRCPQKSAGCSETEPQSLEATPGHTVACHLYHQP